MIVSISTRIIANQKWDRKAKESKTPIEFETNRSFVYVNSTRRILEFASRVSHTQYIHSAMDHHANLKHFTRHSLHYYWSEHNKFVVFNTRLMFIIISLHADANRFCIRRTSLIYSQFIIAVAVVGARLLPQSLCFYVCCFCALQFESFNS